MTAVRAAAIVFGINALALLAVQAIGQTHLHEALLMRQTWLPGALLLADILENWSFGVWAVLLAVLVTRSYWRSLLPAAWSWTAMLGSVAAGALFGLFVNRPAHRLLFELFYGHETLTGGFMSETTFDHLGFSGETAVAAISTVLLSPFVEELTDRGILFNEAESLQRWQVALLSMAVFCLSHWSIGGLPKVLAIAPAAALFVGIRLWAGSFVYSALAHMALNACSQ